MSVARTRRRRARVDVTALRRVVAARELTRTSLPRGHVYVLPGHEDDPYQVYRVGRRALVLRSRSGGYLIFEGDHRPVTEWWYPSPPDRRSPEEATKAARDAGVCPPGESTRR